MWIQDTGNQKRVNFDRLKKFHQWDFIKYKDLKFDDSYIRYQKYLQATLKGQKVKFRDQKLELDYKKRLQHLKQNEKKENKKKHVNSNR